MQDRSWEQYGKDDPYYGVLTDPRFKTENLTEATLQEFFQSGEEHVAEVLGKIDRYFPRTGSAGIRSVLDFGCGTGRLLVPFAQRFPRVTGVDIAPGMLQEAEKNLQRRSLNNVTLVRSENITHTHFEQPFDLVHTFIVLQHIPLAAGYPILDKLLSLISDGGYGMLHLTYANHLSAFRNRKARLAARYKWFHQLSNLVKGKSPNAPGMQMNNYDLPRVLGLLKKHHPRQIALDFTDHAGYLGVCLYVHK